MLKLIKKLYTHFRGNKAKYHNDKECFDEWD